MLRGTRFRRASRAREVPNLRAGCARERGWLVILAREAVRGVCFFSMFLPFRFFVRRNMLFSTSRLHNVLYGDDHLIWIPSQDRTQTWGAWVSQADTMG